MALVELEVTGAVATVTLADDARRNALSAELMDELAAALDRAEADDRVRVVVVTNRGRTFCAGADLSGRAGGPGVDLAGLLGRIQASPKPYVGRLAGHCVAGGVGLAAAMDLSVAVEGATFGFTEVRLGLAPAIISVVCLPKMRRGDALEAFLRGRRFGAIDAAAMGLINAAVPAEGLDAAVAEVVGDLLAAHPDALAAAKRLVYDLGTRSREDAVTWTNDLSTRLFRSEAAREGMAAYLEKRPPSWAPTPGTD